ncbi:MAG: BRO family protein [bacterium]|nr:BRO family protein [bacterium]
MNQLSNAGHSSVFESVKKVNDNGVEYWLARDFQSILQYSSWDKFLNVVEKAKEACRNSGHNSADHFSHMVKMVLIGSGARRETEDIKLSRYACYLIIQNADPAKEIVALGQTYFTVQTRRQELSDEFGKFESDEEKRVFLRQPKT